MAACGQNNTCASACRGDHPCGALDPSPANASAATGAGAGTTASSTSGSATADSTTVYSGPAGDSGSSSSKSSAARPPSFEVVRLYSTAGMLGLFCLGFAYLL